MDDSNEFRKAAFNIAKELLQIGASMEAAIEAVREALQEAFTIGTFYAYDLAKEVVEFVWDDVVAEVEQESADTQEATAERREARTGRY